MAKKSYIGIDGKARKIKKWYIGVDSKARKVKKGYIGVGGVARPFITSEGVEYYGRAIDLSEAKYNLAGASVGNYALFAGGQIGYNSYSNYVEAFDTSLTKSTLRTTAAGLQFTRCKLTGGSVGDYAVFAGGWGGTNPTSSTRVEAFDTSLTKKTPTAMTNARFDMANASVGNYTLFAGGYDNNGGYYSTIDAYSSGLGRKSTVLSSSRTNVAGASVGNYALFAGGYVIDSTTHTPSWYSTVDAYNASLVKSTCTSLSTPKASACSASVGDYAIFAGGGGGTHTTSYSNVDAYNASLVRSTPVALSVDRAGGIGISTEKYALFGGGNSTSGVEATVDIYDSSLVRSTATDLSVSRTRLAGASVGNYALFAGGYDNSSTAYANVDVYIIN